MTLSRIDFDLLGDLKFLTEKIQNHCYMMYKDIMRGLQHGSFITQGPLIVQNAAATTRFLIKIRDMTKHLLPRLLPKLRELHDLVRKFLSKTKSIMTTPAMVDANKTEQELREYLSSIYSVVAGIGDMVEDMQKEKVLKGQRRNTVMDARSVSCDNTQARAKVDVALKSRSAHQLASVHSALEQSSAIEHRQRYLLEQQQRVDQQRKEAEERLKQQQESEQRAKMQQLHDLQKQREHQIQQQVQQQREQLQQKQQEKRKKTLQNNKTQDNPYTIHQQNNQNGAIVFPQNGQQQTQDRAMVSPISPRYRPEQQQQNEQEQERQRKIQLQIQKLRQQKLEQQQKQQLQEQQQEQQQYVKPPPRPKGSRIRAQTQQAVTQSEKPPQPAKPSTNVPIRPKPQRIQMSSSLSQIYDNPSVRSISSNLHINLQSNSAPNLGGTDASLEEPIKMLSEKIMHVCELINSDNEYYSEPTRETIAALVPFVQLAHERELYKVENQLRSANYEFAIAIKKRIVRKNSVLDLKLAAAKVVEALNLLVVAEPEETIGISDDDTETGVFFQTLKNLETSEFVHKKAINWNEDLRGIKRSNTKEEMMRSESDVEPKQNYFDDDDSVETDDDSEIIMGRKKSARKKKKQRRRTFNTVNRANCFTFRKAFNFDKPITESYSAKKLVDSPLIVSIERGTFRIGGTVDLDIEVCNTGKTKLKQIFVYVVKMNYNFKLKQNIRKVGSVHKSIVTQLQLSPPGFPVFPKNRWNGFVHIELPSAMVPSLIADENGMKEILYYIKVALTKKKKGIAVMLGPVKIH